jgi:outer membrane biosynthesis protein TonB
MPLKMEGDDEGTERKTKGDEGTARRTMIPADPVEAGGFIPHDPVLAGLEPGETLSADAEICSEQAKRLVMIPIGNEAPPLAVGRSPIIGGAPEPEPEVEPEPEPEPERKRKPEPEEEVITETEEEREPEAEEEVISTRSTHHTTKKGGRRR